MFNTALCWPILRVLRRHIPDILLGLLLLITCAQHALWTQTGSWELQYVYDPPSDKLLDPVWKMDSLWNKTIQTQSPVQDPLLEQLLVTLMKPTRHCHKMLELGGKICRKLPDGSKKVCLDEDVSPGAAYCLSYSFGVGNDFSFDKEMVKYGCETYAFDQDKQHMIYPSVIEGVHFVKIRLGKERILIYETQFDGSQFRYMYRPIDDIQSGLSHSNVTLDYLKMDIEGAEWDIFVESMFKTDILYRTKQLALEFHLENLRSDIAINNNMTVDQQQQAIKRYQSVFDELRKIGFELAWFEPNFYVPTTSTIGNRTFHVFGETLWLNPKWKRPQVLPHGWKTKT